MKATYRIIITFFLCFTLPTAFAQIIKRDTLSLTWQQYEELFLKQNLLLVAEKYNINQADALLLQAKLWPNPSLSIDNVNLWATKKQLAHLEEPLPAIFGKAAKNTQFSIQLEQLIQTAGKRNKQLAIEQLSVDLAKQEFEELLRNLKYQFRANLSRLQHLQQYQEEFLLHLKSVQSLIKGYQKQVENRNISKVEFLRLQVLQLELSTEINEIGRARNVIESELKISLNIIGTTSLWVSKKKIPSVLKGVSIEQLMEQALEVRPDLNILAIENRQNKIRLEYEKAHRIPDFTLMTGYDRGGGVWPSFLSFGIAFDIPIFNRNQGNIKHAQIGITQSSVLLEAMHLRVKAEVMKGYENVLNAMALYEEIGSTNPLEMKVLLANYTHNFANRNVSLLEYLDFQRAYLENTKIVLESERDVHLLFEELKYIVGIEIN